MSIIGFDAREAWISPNKLWPKERRTQFLLNEGAVKPLSVDQVVWKTVIKTSQEPRQNHIGDVEHLDLEIDQWENWPLANDAEVLAAGIARSVPMQGKLVVIIAIVYPNDSKSYRLANWPYLNVLRDQPHPDWRILGYDVADGGFVSGLMNCGYESSEKREAQARWLTSLNANHLFTTVEAANSFREWTDKRVPEHAPFEVFALYEVGQLTPGRRA